ncbi:MAG: phage portal protein [Spirochaetales bacterium]
MNNSLWAKVVALFARLFGIPTAQPEVMNGDLNLLEWWSVYRSKAAWLDYQYVTADGRKRTRKRFTINAAKIACAEMAGLVLAEIPEVTAGPLVDQVILKERFWDNLTKALEYQGALGGQVIRVTLEGGLEPEIGLDFIKAQTFMPLAWDNSHVYEGAFIDRRVVGKKTLLRVETHRKGTEVEGTREGYLITNRVFDDGTGLEVPLSDFDEELVASVFVPTTEPLFAYIRNPEANNIEPESPLGVSLFANAMDTLQALDIAFDGLKTEILLGRQRIALPGVVMRSYIDPEDGKRKKGFDPTDEAYIRLEGDDADKLKPVDLSGQLRVEQYRQGIQTLLDILSVQTGFSAGYFSFDGTSVKTATEVVSDNSKTYKTMQAYREALDVGLKHVFRVINALGTLYGIPGATVTDPLIAWNDSVIESRDAKAAYWTSLVTAKLTDKVSALKAIHGLDDAGAEAMAAKIKDENAAVTSASLFGTGA